MNLLKNRQIALDTETTGMNVSGAPYIGHKIIEIGAVEILERKLTGFNFHTYLQPDRCIEKNAFLVHGITSKFLLNKPKFINIVKSFLNYIKNSELIVHNSNFDISFINYELNMLNMNLPKIEDICKVTDTLFLARKLFPGKKNNLNALCIRYNIPINRDKHSAILDAKILSKLYLLMTAKQNTIDFVKNINCFDNKNSKSIINISLEKLLKKANNVEVNLHEKYLKNMQKKFGKCLWKKKCELWNTD